VDHIVGDFDDEGIVDANEEDLWGVLSFGWGILLAASRTNTHLLLILTYQKTYLCESKILGSGGEFDFVFYGWNFEPWKIRNLFGNENLLY
jgi:hypothetical protein